MDELGDLSFDGDVFPPASIVCDTRDGELAIVVEQDGGDLIVRWFSNPLGTHKAKAADFALVEGKRVASLGFVVDTMNDDEGHTAKVVIQLTALLNAMPPDLLDLAYRNWQEPGSG